MKRLPLAIPTRTIRMPGGLVVVTTDLRDPMTDFLLAVRVFWTAHT